MEYARYRGWHVNVVIYGFVYALRSLRCSVRLRGSLPGGTIGSRDMVQCIYTIGELCTVYTIGAVTIGYSVV